MSAVPGWTGCGSGTYRHVALLALSSRWRPQSRTLGGKGRAVSTHPVQGGGFSRIQHPSLPPSQSCPSCPASADPTLPPVSQLTPRSWLLSQSRAVRSVTDPPRCPSEGQRISACVDGKWGINQSLNSRKLPTSPNPYLFHNTPLTPSVPNTHSPELYNLTLYGS